MTITALLELTLKADSVPDAPRILTKTLEATRAFAGNEGVEVLYDVTDPAHVVVIVGGPPSRMTRPTAPGERRRRERQIWAPSLRSDRG